MGFFSSLKTTWNWIGYIFWKCYILPRVFEKGTCSNYYLSYLCDTYQDCAGFQKLLPNLSLVLNVSCGGGKKDICMICTKLVWLLKDIMSFLNFMLQPVHYTHPVGIVSKLKLVWRVLSFSLVLSLCLQLYKMKLGLWENGRISLEAPHSPIPWTFPYEVCVLCL